MQESSDFKIPSAPCPLRVSKDTTTFDVLVQPTLPVHNARARNSAIQFLGLRMNLEGLHFYEVVLLGCGVAFFVVLLFAFMRYVVKGKAVGGLFPFFFIPLVMIGFPGIQKIQFDKAKVEIETKSREVEARPANTQARKELEEKLESVSQRTKDDPETAITLAKGYAALGKTDQGLDWAVKAAQSKPNAPEVRKTIVDLSAQQISKSVPPPTPTGIQPVTDPQEKARLTRAVEELKKQPELTPEARLTLAQGQAALGQTEAAKTNADQAVRQAPQLGNLPTARIILRQPGLNR